MVLFLFTVCVVLLNIFIAQLSGSYQHLQQNAQRELEVNRLWMVVNADINSIHLGKVNNILFHCVKKMNVYLITDGENEHRHQHAFQKKKTISKT